MLFEDVTREEVDEEILPCVCRESDTFVRAVPGAGDGIDYFVQCRGCLRRTDQSPSLEWATRLWNHYMREIKKLRDEQVIAINELLQTGGQIDEIEVEGSGTGAAASRQAGEPGGAARKRGG